MSIPMAMAIANMLLVSGGSGYYCGACTGCGSCFTYTFGASYFSVAF